MPRHLILLALLCNPLTLLGTEPPPAALSGMTVTQQQIEHPPSGIDHANFVILHPTETEPTAVVTLWPGQNQTGTSYYLRDSLWTQLAQAQGWILILPHLVSDRDLLLQAGGGYFQASQGSGTLFLDLLRGLALHEYPLFLYGFSGGARFVHTFVHQYPEHVTAWAVISASNWETPPSEALPYGLVSCGQKDAPRYGATLRYFQNLRRVGHPAAWIPLAQAGHHPAPQFEKLAQQVFVFYSTEGEPDWHGLDITNQILTLDQSAQNNLLLSYYPSHALAEQAKTLLQQ